MGLGLFPVFKLWVRSAFKQSCEAGKVFRPVRARSSAPARNELARCAPCRRCKGYFIGRQTGTVRKAWSGNLGGDRTMKIVSMVGSLRRDSWNHKLSRQGVLMLRARGVDVEEASLAGLPLFNGDLDGGGYPEPVSALREALRPADGLLIAAPEFNHSIPAALKNAIEWACRPPSSLTDKVVFAMGATPGKSGGIRMHLHLSDCLQCEGCWVIPKPLVLVPNAATVFGPEGEFLDLSVGETLEEGMTRLVDTINRMKGNPA